MRLALLVAVLLVALPAVASASSPDPKRMVLTLQDMPTGFKVDTSHYYDAAAASKSTDVSQAQLKKWGYVTGYETDFSRDVSLSHLLTGAIDIASSASVYRSETGAEESLALSVDACHKAPAQELSVGAKIGDEAHLCSSAQRSGSYTFQVYAVMWRHGRLKGAVIVAGIKGGVSPTQAVKLAQLASKRLH